MRVGQPLRTRVVQVGQRALLQLLRRRFVLGQDAVGIAGHHLGLAHHQVLGVEPVLAQFVQPRGGGGDRLRARIVGIIGGGDVGGQAFGEGEGFEGGRRGVAGSIFQRSAHPQRPEFVEARVEDAEAGVVVAGDGVEKVGWSRGSGQPYKNSVLRNNRGRNIPS